MHTSRRTFLKKGAIAFASAAIFSNELFAGKNAKEILGIQLYTVRENMSKDPSGTLKLLSDMGYKYVEHANYINRKFYGYSPTDFKQLLNSLGLQMKSGHTYMDKRAWDAAKSDFTDKWKYTVEDAATVGQEFVITPWLDNSLFKNMDDLRHFLGAFNKSGELCKQHGMKFGYHNHNFEFKVQVEDKLVYDIILAETDPNLVIQQLDMGNMYGAGGRALDLLKKYPARFQIMHVKDEIKGNVPEFDGYESTLLGTGVVPVKEILDLARNNGINYFIIEQESYQGKVPIDCAKENLAKMKSWNFA